MRIIQSKPKGIHGFFGNGKHKRLVGMRYILQENTKYQDGNNLLQMNAFKILTKIRFVKIILTLWINNKIMPQN
jgi:hypothetical protein